MTAFSTPDYDDHHLVQFVHDPESGLRAIIALHRTHPRAAGGIRMKAYSSDDDALRDALLLSRAMSYKWAFARIGRGGGKTVVIADPSRDKTPELLHALGRAIHALGGRYYAGSDVGTGPEDMRIIQQVTPFVRGADPEHGDSSEATAYGVLQGIRAGVRRVFEREDLEGLTVAVQGVGHVGARLCGLLHERGARLIVADLEAGATDRMRERYRASVMPANEILTCEADVLAPCALGGVIDEAIVDRIRAHVICGAANNQLSSDAMAPRLHARRVLFVPDYAVNSGGIINGVAEGPDYDRSRVWRSLDRIYDHCLEVFELARTNGTSSLEAANLISRRLMREQGQRP